MISLLATPEGWAAFLLRVDPRAVNVPDLLEPDEQDLSVWMVEAVAGDDVIVPVEDLRRGMAHLLEPEVLRHGPEVADLMVGIHLGLMLMNPRSPYAYGLRFIDPPETTDGQPVGMTVIYRGRFFDRDDEGVMTPTGDKIAYWPTREDWRRAGMAVRLAKRRGWS